MEVHLCFFEGHSEVNTLGGELNIFLNKNKVEQKMWYDFSKCLSQAVDIKNTNKCKIVIQEEENQYWHHL